MKSSPPGASTRTSSASSGVPTRSRFLCRFFHHGSGKCTNTRAMDPAAKRGSTSRAVPRATGGTPAVPLDDAFIHFQYARSFWEGRGFAFTAGAAPVPGATSLLWPLLLTLPYGLGFRAEHLIWVAWAFGWVSLGL